MDAEAHLSVWSCCSVYCERLATIYLDVMGLCLVLDSDNFIFLAF